MEEDINVSLIENFETELSDSLDNFDIVEFSGANSLTELPTSQQTITIESDDITWYFTQDVDYLGITGMGYIYTPSLELTMANNNLSIEDLQLTCNTEISQCLLLNRLIYDNFYLQRMSFTCNTILALILIGMCLSKLRELGRRIVGGKKSRNV